MKVERIFKNCVFAISCVTASLFIASPLFADTTYTVKKGDTLYSISRKYEITVPELKTANNLESDFVKEGARLVIPSANIQNAAALSSSNASSSSSVPSTAKEEKKISIYEVQKGDTLYAIARKFQTTLPEILSLNNIETTATIMPGQKIKVPGKDGASVASGQTGRDNGSAQGSKESGKDSGNTGAESKNPRMDISSGSSSGNLASTGGSNNASNNSGSKTGKDESKEKQYAEVKTAKELTENTNKSLLWPLSNPVVKKVNGKVSGVLLTGKSLEAVCAVREGTVMYTGVYRGFGEVVFVQSKTGLIYSYTGLGSVSCKKGDYVKAGDEIGRTGKGSDTSIKFMVFQNGMPVNPEKAPRG